MTALDVVDALYEDLDGTTVAGHEVAAYTQLTWDFDQRVTLSPPAVAVEIADLGSTPGEGANFLDLINRVAIAVYAEGQTAAKNVAREIADRFVGKFGVPLGDGLVDSTTAETLPRPVAYASDRINKNETVLRFVTRQF